VTDEQRQTIATDQELIDPRSSGQVQHCGLRKQFQKPPRRISPSRAHPLGRGKTATKQSRRSRGVETRSSGGEFNRDRNRSPSEAEETHPFSAAAASARGAAELGDDDCCCGGGGDCPRASVRDADEMNLLGRLARHRRRPTRVGRPAPQASDRCGSVDLDRRIGYADGGWAGRPGWHP
jgi:hypothetical protein